MKILRRLNAVIFVLLLIIFTPQGYASTTLMFLEGFWVYGFEQSLLETCDGKKYWMWTPNKFKGKYTSEGYRNPVMVTGYLLPPNPDDNMNSSFAELNVVNIKHVRKAC